MLRAQGAAEAGGAVPELRQGPWTASEDERYEVATRGFDDDTVRGGADSIAIDIGR